MNYQDALKILRSKTATDLSEITKNYREIIKESHPDKGGSTDWFISVREAYSLILSQYEYKHKIYDKETNEETEEMRNLSEGLQAAIQEVIEKIIDPLTEIAIMGSWIWVSGNTKTYKESLKELGFKFSRNKLSWYWHEGKYRRGGKKTFSMTDIENRYGKININKKVYAIA